MSLDRLWSGNTKPLPKNTAPVFAEDINPIIDKLNSIEIDADNFVEKQTGYSLVADTEIAKIHASGSDNQSLAGLVPYTGASGSVNLGNNSVTTSELILPKTAGTGIKIDTALPTFGWKDLLGPIYPHPIGGTAPSSTLLKGNGTHMRAYSFSAGDVVDSVLFHIPHDYVPNSHVFLHAHWKHSGTAISGNLVLTLYVNYAKGYNQAGQIFGNEITITQTIPTANVATFPRYGHFINEFQLSNAGGDATHLNTALLEPDGIINVAMVATTIPTILGAPAGSANEPFIFMIDLHYQSTQTATKDKNLPFYT